MDNVARGLIGMVIGALLLSACGSPAKPAAVQTPSATPTPSPSASPTLDPNRPTPQQIVAGLEKEMTFNGQLLAQRACIGEAFYNSTLSDDALKAITVGNANYSPSPADQQALVSLLATAVKACSPDATPTASPTS